MYTQSSLFHDEDYGDFLASKIISTVTGLGLIQSSELIENAGGIHSFATLTYYDLVNKHRIGAKRAKSILALTKWSLLLNEIPPDTTVRVDRPADLANLFLLEMGLLQQEELRIALLDSRNHLKSIQTLYRGSLNAMTIRISEVFRMAIIQNAASIILIHNHPSGDPAPSLEDVDATKEIVQAGKSLSIQVIDHLIIGKGYFVSLKNRNLGGL